MRKLIDLYMYVYNKGTLLLACTSMQADQHQSYWPLCLVQIIAILAIIAFLKFLAHQHEACM